MAMAGERGDGAVFREEWGDTSPPGAFAFRKDIVGVVIPARFRKIGTGAFRGCPGLTELRLPDTLTEIGNNAFRGCRGLTELRLPDTLTEIGAGAFRGCPGLTELRLPDTLTKIGNNAFSGCYGLTELRLPDTLTEIGDDAFGGCSGLPGLRLPDTLTKIGAGAFRGCSALEQLQLPGSIGYLGPGAFSKCTTLRLVAMYSVIEFGSRQEFGVATMNCGQFEGCASLKAVSAPAEVASRFPADMFEGCGTAPSALLAAATADLALCYYWSRQSHLRCSPAARDTVIAVMSVCVRLDRASGPQLPALPNEIWCCVLEFMRRHELAAVL